MERELVLGRIGHYHDPGSQSCRAALVVDVDYDPRLTTSLSPPTTVSLVVWQTDGEPERHIAVPAEVATLHGAEGSHATFHLNRDCPWGR